MGSFKVYSATEIKMQHMSWLVYGRSGSGKTTLLATFPGRLYVVNFVQERGALTLRGHPNCDVADVETPEDMNDALTYFIANHTKYSTFAVDSITTFVDVLYQSVASRRKVDWKTDWTMWKNQVFGMVERIRKLPVECVYTATLSAIEDEVEPGKRGGPAMFKSLERDFPARMEAVVYLESEATERGRPAFRAYLSGKTMMLGRVRGTMPQGVIEPPS